MARAKPGRRNHSAKQGIRWIMGEYADPGYKGWTKAPGLVWMDLDETLVYTIPYQQHTWRCPSGPDSHHVSPYYPDEFVHVRPGAMDLLAWLHEQSFLVAVVTRANEAYAEFVCQILFWD